MGRNCKQLHLHKVLGALVVIFGVLLLNTLTTSADTTRYVKVGGTGDGTSWATASGTLQAMIDAVEVTGGGTVCVASGIYTPTTEVGGTGPEYQSFQMKSGVGIYGGFPSTGSPNWNQRDWKINQTILSGEIGDSGNKTDNCYHVFYHPTGTNLDRTGVLDGFTISGGYAYDPMYPNERGGGMCNYYVSPTIRNCKFEDNLVEDSGGGMYNSSGSPMIVNCSFTDNTASLGGGVRHYESSPTMINCTFSGNSASAWGGGMYIYHCSPIITNCTFSTNSASYDGGAISQFGGNSSPKITNCILWGNSYNEYHVYAGTTIFTYNNVQGGSGEPWFGIGCIDTDPVFVNPGSGDFHLQQTSPCIDAGSNTAISVISEDFEGDARIINATVDMGIDETLCIPISYWAFNEGTGTIAYDSVDGNDGTIEGYPSWVSGISDDALSFDGDGDYVSLPEDSLRLAHITQLAWVYPATLSGRNPIITMEATTGTNRGVMLEQYNGNFRFYVGTGSDEVQYVTGSATKANEWYQVAGTYSGTEACIWINGEKMDCEPLSGNIAYDPNRDMRIGSWAPTNPSFFNGIIDEVRVYARALTIQEIEILYESMIRLATDPATNVGTSTAILNGTLLSMGTANSVAIEFEYGIQSGSYPWSAPAVESPMIGTGAFHADVSSLLPNTTYYYRARAEGSAAAFGNEVTFNTLSLRCDLTTSSGVGGSVMTPGEGTYVYDCGKVAAIIAMASPCYEFVEWTGSGTPEIANPGSPNTTITVNDDYSVHANFTPKSISELTTSSTTGGMVINPGEGTYPYDCGTVVSIIAEATASYRFSDWTGDIDTIANPGSPNTTITMNNDYIIQANFILDTDPLDYGDAPTPYPTLSGSMGAAHWIYTMWLGQSVDVDLDGQPDPDALGDDNNGIPDDEDGVVFLDPICPLCDPDIEIFVTNTGSFSAYLDAWIDFNRDGDWDDLYEQIFSAEPVVSGTNSLWFWIPPDADVQLGDSYARFRLHDDSGGVLPYDTDFWWHPVDGEVEDYKITIEPTPLDFGDAPAPYPTLSGSMGAAHWIDTMWLGQSVDVDLDGQPDLDALGDDNNRIPDDEDGITILGPICSDCDPDIEVFVTNTGSFSTYLDAWIDFNRDGDWDDLYEQIFSAEPVVSGTNSLWFWIPPEADVQLGDSYARFRLHDDSGGVLPYDTEFWWHPVDGEVEDYKITIEPTPLDYGDAPAPYPTLSGSNGAEHWILDGRLGQSIDIDLDGQPDLDAMGDDNNGVPDDEDGVTFIDPICPDCDPYIEVFIIDEVLDQEMGDWWDYYLYAWIDFNQDGDWDDPEEQILDAELVNTGTHFFWITVPTDAELGDTYARFRLSYWDSGVDPYGYGGLGEVEDYKITIEPTPLDYGDAPAPYPTLSGSNGAHHWVEDAWLGQSVDIDLDGQPDPNALGDDNNGIPDDEDGVTFIGPICPDCNTEVEVFVTDLDEWWWDYYLYAWIDFNQDGDWDDPDEQILYEEPVYHGTYSFWFTTPPDAQLGDTFARFRLTSGDTEITPSGYGWLGEVEDYKVTINVTPLDFGDAPVPYPTLESGSGACHWVNEMWLGQKIDIDTDGQPDPGALGDDNDGSDDEDGVTFLAPLYPDSWVDLEVFVTKNALLDPYLDAWIDFDQDGDWDIYDDQILSEVPVSPGTNYLGFMVPSDALIGETYARFRLHNQWSGIAPYGEHYTGEVEDYKITIGATVDIHVTLQGDNRPNPEGWEIPLNIGFYPTGKPDSWLTNPASATWYFTATATAEWIAGGTKATVTVGPVNPGTYDITTDSTTTLLNVKRGVKIQ